MSTPALNPPIIYYINLSQKINSDFIEINNVTTETSLAIFSLKEQHSIPFNKFEALTKEVEKLSELKDNWDGYGGIPVLKSISISTHKLISVLGSPLIDGITDIFPNPHGTITIEWQNRNKEKLALEIGKDNFSYFIRFTDKTPQLVDGEDILSSVEQLTSDLENLFSEEIQKYLLQ